MRNLLKITFRGRKEYNSVYEIEKSLGLVVKKNEGKNEQVVKKEIDEDMSPYSTGKT